MTLEERLLMSATPPAMIAEVIPEQSIQSDAIAALIREAEPNAATTSEPAILVVVDGSIDQFESLIGDIRASSSVPVSVLTLDAQTDGVQQITDHLQSLEQVTSIHLISHGGQGEIQLGTARLNGHSLPDYADQIWAWQRSLTSDADILIYGCEVAKTPQGQELLKSIQTLTGADIAASTDLTGSSNGIGDWELEFRAGSIETAGFQPLAASALWQGLLPVGDTVTVTTTQDSVDAPNLTSIAALAADPGADGLISLREAVRAANANSDTDTILLQAGTYQISIIGNEDLSAAGDLDIAQDVIIEGLDENQTVLRGNGSDRLFDVQGTGTLTIRRMTVTAGHGDAGGAVRVNTSGAMTADRVIFSGNQSDNHGGAIWSDGTLNLTNVSIQQNSADNGNGGGLYSSGRATITGSTFSENTAIQGGAIFQSGSANSLDLTNVTVSGNSATQSGGGVTSSASASFQNVTIAHNSAGVSGAGLVSSGPAVHLRNVLFSENRLTSNTSANISGTVVSHGNNLSSDLTGNLNATGDLTGIDAELLPLAQHEGYTATHALRSSSAAIDAGTSVQAPAQDQTGKSRDGAVDIGAWEYRRAILSTGQFNVNTTTSGDQLTSSATRGSARAVARDHAGNYVIVWSSLGQDGSGWGVYGRRFDVNGTALGSEFRITEHTSNNQQWAQVASDAAGNFVVAWTSTNQDGPGQSIYARRFSSTGVPLSGEFSVNTASSGNQKNPSIAMNTAGDFVIVWDGAGVEDTDGIYFRRFSANGLALDATERLVNSSTAGIQEEASVAMADDGDFVVVWRSSNFVYFRQFNSNGVSTSNSVQVDSFASVSRQPAVAMDQTGNFVIAYRENLTLTGIWMRGFNSNGTERFSWIRAATGDSSSPSLDMTADGRFLLMWQQEDGDENQGVFARRFQANGAANGAAFEVASSTAGNQVMASGVILDPDNLIVVWSGEGPSDTSGVYARQFGTAPVTLLTANPDHLVTNSGTAVISDVRTNDTHSPSADLIVLDVTRPVNGTAMIAADGRVQYTPNGGFSGSDSFQYVLSDGLDGTQHFWSLNANGVDSVGDADGVFTGTSTVLRNNNVAAWFDESNDRVQIPDFDYSNEFTVSFEFRLDENSGNDYQYLYSHGDANVINSLNIFIGENSQPGYANILKTTFADTNDSYNVNALNFNAASLIGDGLWHTYTLVVKAGTGSTVYIDGVQRAFSAGRGGNSFNPTGSLLLGSRQDLDSERFFGGGLDSVRILNRALTGTEVAQLDAGNSPVTASQQAQGTVHITVQNAFPIAEGGGAYSISEGASLTLDASGSSDPEGGPLSWSWDLDGDGAYDDAVGATPTLSWTDLQSMTPALNDNGTYTLRVAVTDSTGLTSYDTASLTIQNTAPQIALSGAASVLSGDTFTLSLAATDPGFDSISSIRVIWGDGQFSDIAGNATSATHTYTGHPGQTYTISVNASDEDGVWSNIGSPFSVLIGNRPPTAVQLSNNRVASHIDGAIVGTISFTDLDAGDSHTVTVSDNRFEVVGSSLRLKTGVSLNPVFEPVIPITITVTDSAGAQGHSDFTVAVNSSPVASADSFAVDGTRLNTFNNQIQLNDSDADGDSLTVTLVTGPVHAQNFSITGSGSFSYRARSGFSGIDSFVYRITDGLGASSTATVQLTVNQPATLSINQIISSINENTVLSAPLRIATISVVDDGIGTNVLSLSGADAARFSILNGNELFLNVGTVPDFDFARQFEVNIVVDDSGIQGIPDSSSRVVVSIQNVNRSPVATPAGVVTLNEDSGTSLFAAAGFFSDPDAGDHLTYRIQQTGGNPLLLRSLSINSATGRVSMTPAANQWGSAILQITATDGGGLSAASQLTLNVLSVNDSPVVTSHRWTVPFGTTITVQPSGVLTGAFDVDGDLLTAIISAQPATGTLTLNGNGGFTYLPGAETSGTVRFTYMATDGVSTSHPSTVDLVILPGAVNPLKANSTSSTSGVQSSQSSNDSEQTSSNSGNTASNNAGTMPGSTTGVPDRATNSGDANKDSAQGPSLIVPASPSQPVLEELSLIARTDIPGVRFERIENLRTGTNMERSSSSNSLRFMSSAESAISPSNRDELTLLTVEQRREYLHRQFHQESLAWQQLDSLEEDLAGQRRIETTVQNSVGVVTTGLSLGYVIWIVRGGMLLSGVLAQMPAWTMLDPLNVIDDQQREEDTESLQNIVDGQESHEIRPQPEPQAGNQTTT